MKINLLKSLFLILIVSFLSGCDDDVVGKWDPMEWKYQNVSEGIEIIKPAGKDKDHIKYATQIKVNKPGAVDIVCKNYKTFWFEEYPDMTYESDFRTQFQNSCCAMKIEGNTIHCEFFNTEQRPDNFTITITAGDIFYQFKITLD